MNLYFDFPLFEQPFRNVAAIGILQTPHSQGESQMCISFLLSLSLNINR